MNRALRRLVAGEEETRREKRQRLQQILKQRIADAVAAAAAAASAVSYGAPPASSPPVASTATSDPESAGGKPASSYDDDEDEVIEQQKLLSSATAPWRCVEDSQQAVCIAMNRRQTLFAIGEKDGRISIWDNTTIRVITKELDPTSIVLPTVAEENGADAAVAAEEKQEEEETDGPPAKRAKTSEAPGDQDGSADGDSATNEEASVDGNDDGSVEADDDEVNGAAMDVDDTGSVEDTLSADENTGDDQPDGEDDESATNAPDLETDAHTRLRKLSDGSSAVTPGVSLDELRIAKTMLKHVVSIAWSCDSSLLFAGCEEKSSRRGRLCVWDAEAAWLLSTFSFDGAVNAVSAHPTNRDLVIVCSYNAVPVLLNVRTRESTELSAIPIVNATLTVTPPPNSRHPSLVVNCRYGVSGRFIYCATSKSTVAILDSETLACVDAKYLTILVQFVDLAVNEQETALVFTSSKGVHEFAIHDVATNPSLHETRLHATGAVRAPWALCCFSSDGGYVVGMPIVRHRHVGESGLYTWHRGTGRVQHNLGVKDGVNSICWDVRRDAIIAVSCAGAIHALEEEFMTEWPGTMYPAGFRLITDNELDMEAIERELGEHDDAKPKDETNGSENHDRIVDVFTMRDEDGGRVLPPVENERWYIPSIPITQHLKRHYQHDFHVERHFGLGQSVFEPLKSAIKKPTSNSKKKKKTSASVTTSSTEAVPKAVATKSKSKSKSSSSKKRRR